MKTRHIKKLFLIALAVGSIATHVQGYNYEIHMLMCRLKPLIPLLTRTIKPNTMASLAPTIPIIANAPTNNTLLPVLAGALLIGGSFYISSHYKQARLHEEAQATHKNACKTDLQERQEHEEACNIRNAAETKYFNAEQERIKQEQAKREKKQKKYLKEIKKLKDKLAHNKTLINESQKTLQESTKTEQNYNDNPQTKKMLQTIAQDNLTLHTTLLEAAVQINEKIQKFEQKLAALNLPQKNNRNTNNDSDTEQAITPEPK
jgi:hypothetical protein